MIDTTGFVKYINEYKEVFFSRRWKKQKYKWEAVKSFQQIWDAEASDFLDMLRRSLETASQVLRFSGGSPVSIVLKHAETSPEEVRSMFRNLYSEQANLAERVEQFASWTLSLDGMPNNKTAGYRKHELAASVYLWLRYPDQYYIYNAAEGRKLVALLGAAHDRQKGQQTDDIEHFTQTCDELNALVTADPAFAKLLQSKLDDTCYHDPELKILTGDICQWLVSYARTQDYKIVQPDGWEGTDFDPGLSVEDWIQLLQDKNVFTTRSLEVMRRIKDSGGAASCKQLETRYGATWGFYNGVSIGLARRVCKAAHIAPDVREGGSNRFWAVLYIGRYEGKGKDGSFVWKLRDELSEALDHVDLSAVPLYASTSDVDEPSYWWVNTSSELLCDGETDSAMQRICSVRGNSESESYRPAVRTGDCVIVCETNSTAQITALGYVAEDPEGDDILLHVTQILESPVHPDELTSCPELEDLKYLCEPGTPFHSLSKNEYDLLLRAIEEGNVPGPDQYVRLQYTKTDFLQDVFFSEEYYDGMVSVLRRKKNIVLQGPPGVGKTYAARRLAWSMLGCRDEERIEFVQFHQSYSYEDFVMGYKPTPTGFELKQGTFYRFCQKASSEPDAPFFFIIDEINRGNISKIFGELLMLIECGYRGTSITLAYDGTAFSVPDNVYIIGMMNTADRSLAMIDYALRRRFSFFDIEPGFDADGFRRYQSGLNSDRVDDLVNRIKTLNSEIAQDPALGRGFCIGHSYLCGADECSEEWLRTVIEYELLPMLREYAFDDEERIDRWTNLLRGVLP